MREIEMLVTPHLENGWYVDTIPNKHLHFGKGLVIKLEGNWQLPTITFNLLLDISEYFDTQTITLDNQVLTISGCPTCGDDYEYDTEIYVYRINKNNPFKE